MAKPGGMAKRGVSRMATATVPRESAPHTVAEALSSPEIDNLVEGLEALRWTGRPGYGSRVLVGACLVKSLYALPTWSRTTRLIREHKGLQEAIGGTPRARTLSTASHASCAATGTYWRPVSVGSRPRFARSCPSTGRTWRSMPQTFPPTRTARDTSTRAAPSVKRSATRTRAGDTAPPSRPARVGASTGTSCTWPPARSLGMGRAARERGRHLHRP